jgi:D-alanyl-lipoteichoic acid acyltransferase DltB (MBOAT superfamily)
MLWGYFKKLVIADRIAAAVIALRAPEQTGISFVVLTVFYAIQIYGDFTGGIDIAVGLSEAFGIKLTENFVRPFFSKHIA